MLDYETISPSTKQLKTGIGYIFAFSMCFVKRPSTWWRVKLRTCWLAMDHGPFLCSLLLTHHLLPVKHIWQVTLECTDTEKITKPLTVKRWDVFLFKSSLNIKSNTLSMFNTVYKKNLIVTLYWPCWVSFRLIHHNGLIFDNCVQNIASAISVMGLIHRL